MRRLSDSRTPTCTTSSLREDPKVILLTKGEEVRASSSPPSPSSTRVGRREGGRRGGWGYGYIGVFLKKVWWEKREEPGKATGETAPRVPAFDPHRIPSNRVALIPPKKKRVLMTARGGKTGGREKEPSELNLSRRGGGESWVGG